MKPVRVKSQWIWMWTICNQAKMKVAGYCEKVAGLQVLDLYFSFGIKIYLTIF